MAHGRDQQTDVCNNSPHLALRVAMRAISIRLTIFTAMEIAVLALEEIRPECGY